MIRQITAPSATDFPDPLPGFENIKRYWDNQLEVTVAKLLPGEVYVSTQSEMITTVLGSCVASCIRDPAFGIGGMNHFMLPSGGSDGSSSWVGTDVNSAMRYGNYAMEHLINEILKHGGRRDHLEVKVFGGGKVLAAMTDVGRRNIDFVMHYVRTEGLSVVAEDVGDIYPRKVNYFPQTGRAQMKKLRSTYKDTIVRRERNYLDDLEQHPISGEVELW